MTKRKPLPLKLYFVIDDREFEADFVVARSIPQARRIFNEEYGSWHECDIELVKRIAAPPEWLTEPMWLGADPVGWLEDLGGRRLDSIGAPQWQFGDAVVGYPYFERYRYRHLLKVQQERPS